MKLYFLAIALFVCVGAAQAVYVYQETATSSVGYGTSGNGSYIDAASAVNYYYVNYSKPSTSQSLVWTTLYGYPNNYSLYTNPPRTNWTLNTTCFNQPVIQFRLYSTVTGSGITGTSYGSCYNGSWIQVTNTSTLTNVSGMSPVTFFSVNQQYWRDGVFDNNYNFLYPLTSILSSDALGPQYPQGAAGWHEEGVWWYFNNTLNMSFYDENGTYLSGTSVTYYITNGLNTFSGTTSTGSVLVSDLYEDNYTVTYSASGYEQREMIVSVDQINDSATLYLLQSASSTNVLVTIYNTLTDRVENASVFVQKKNLSGTNYYTVESCYTDALGECLMRLDFFDTTYRFVIYYGGEFKLNSGDKKISQSTISFIINLQNFNVADIFKIASIASNVTNNASSFTFNYTDGYYIISSACLETVKRTGSSLVTTATNCSSTTSGSLTLGFNNATGDEWIGNGYVILSSNNRRYDLVSDSYVVSDFKTQFGRVGLFYFGFLLLGTMVFSAMYSIIASMVMAGVGVWVLNALGFISIGMSAAVSLLIIIVIYIITVKNT